MLVSRHILKLKKPISLLPQFNLERFCSAGQFSACSSVHTRLGPCGSRDCSPKGAQSFVNLVWKKNPEHIYSLFLQNRNNKLFSMYIQSICIIDILSWFLRIIDQLLKWTFTTLYNRKMKLTNLQLGTWIWYSKPLWIHSTKAV